MEPYHLAAISPNGHICGSLRTEVNGSFVPFRLAKGGSPEILTDRGSPLDGEALAIDPQGAVVGATERQPDERGFYWREGRQQILPPVKGYGSLRATALSDSGVAVGYSYTPKDKQEYWRWKAIACVWRKPDQVEAIPLPPGCVASRAYGLNDRGTVVGNAITAEGKTRAFFFDGRASRLLPLLPGGTTNSASAINASGVIVGDSDHRPAASTELPFDVHPVRWQEGRVQDLGLPKGYRYAKAVGINRRGRSPLPRSFCTGTCRTPTITRGFSGARAQEWSASTTSWTLT